MPFSASDIRALLERSDFAVEEAILRLYDRQTADEQNAESTVERNGVGFSAFDAGILSSFAVQIRENRRGYAKGFRLSAKQRVIARKKVLRYAGQLANVANAKEAMANHRANIEAGYHRCPDGVYRQIPRSADGMFDGLCGHCEYADNMEETELAK